MSVNTILKATSNPTYETIIEAMKIIKDVTDVELASVREPQEFETYTDKGSATILFEYKGEKRNMFLIHNDNDDGNSIEPLLKESYTYCSMGTNGNQVEFFRELAKVIGGIVIPDDCADEDSEGFFEIIDSKDNFVMNPKVKALFDGLVDMNTLEKYNFVKKIEKNSELVEIYLGVKNM